MTSNVQQSINDRRYTVSEREKKANMLQRKYGNKVNKNEVFHFVPFAFQIKVLSGGSHV